MAYQCEAHTAYLYDRGGMRRIGQVDPLTYVKWGRVLDDVSSAMVRTAYPSEECAQVLKDIQPGRHEMVIFRGSERVWEGPITRLAYHSTYVEIEARDVIHYAYRTVLHNAYENNYPDIVTVVERVLNTLQELQRKEALDPPINVLPYVTAFTHPDDARTSRKTIPFESTLFEDMDSLAQYAGLDYTAVGRRIILSDTHTVWGKTQTVTEHDFVGEVVITLYGMDLATRGFVLGQEPLDGGPTPVGSAGGIDPYYGEWEVLDTPYNEGGEESVTQAALDSQAQRNISGKNPTPLVVRLPQNSTLNPAGILKISDLIPGVRVPLRATLTLREVEQMQKLKTVTVTEQEGSGETIQVSLNPASMNDVEA